MALALCRPYRKTQVSPEACQNPHLASRFVKCPLVYIRALTNLLLFLARVHLHRAPKYDHICFIEVYCTNVTPVITLQPVMSSRLVTNIVLTSLVAYLPIVFVSVAYRPYVMIAHVCST